MADREGIELARVGTFDLQQGGTQEFTAGMLVDAAERAREQGDKFRAPIKLGHTDPRNDGEPAMGWLHNLRIEGTGPDTVLMGDVTGMPQWLADTAPSAYPDRSIEGHLVELGNGGKGLQVEALALLGVTPPAMASLKSWRQLPKLIAAAAEIPLPAFAAAYEALRDAPELPAEPAESTPKPKEADTMSDTLLKGLRDRLGVSAETDEAGVLSALDAKLKVDPPAVTTEAIAAAYKLTTDQVTTALAAAATPPADPKLPEGHTVISKDALDELRIAAAAGAEARVIQLRVERDETIGAAIAAGKVSPARREHWTKNWDKDPEGTKASIDELEVLYPVAASGYAGNGSERSDATVTDSDVAQLAALAGVPVEALSV